MFLLNLVILFLVDTYYSATCYTIDTYGMIYCYDFYARWYYKNASDYCQTYYGTTLARIDNALKTEGVHYIFNTPPINSYFTVVNPSWVGLTRANESSPWLWDDGETDSSYINWESGYPTNDDNIDYYPSLSGNQDCAAANGWTDALINIDCSLWTFSWICNLDLPYLTCPSGTTQIGSRHYSDVSGCGMEGCDNRYSYSDIDACHLACQSTVGCVAFNWASIGGDKNHLTDTVCTLYDDDSNVGDIWGPNQIFCKLEITYPTPGEQIFIDDNQSYTLNETVQWLKPDNLLSCIVEWKYDDEKNYTRLTNNSYIEIYNYDNILNDLFIGQILLEHPGIMLQVPENCTKIPVSKIRDIYYTGAQGIIRIYIEEPSSFEEYFNQMNISQENVTLMEIGRIPDVAYLYHTRTMMNQENISNYSYGYSTDVVCEEWNIDTKTFVQYVSDALCNPNIATQRGSRLGSGFKNLNSTRRRYLRRRLGFWDDVGDFFEDIVEETYNWAKDLSNTIYEYSQNIDAIKSFTEWVERFIKFLNGEIDEKLDFGISMSYRNGISMDAIANQKFKGAKPLPTLKTAPDVNKVISNSAKNQLKAITLDGTFRFETGADAVFQVYMDFKARFDLFSPDFEYLELKFGAEAYLNAFFNFVLDGKLQLTWLVYQKTKSKWYLIGGVVPVYVRTGIHFEVDIAVQTSASFSANAGLERIFVEYGYRFDGSSWESTGTDYNLNFEPYFNYGYTLGGKDEDDCIDAGLSIIPNIRLSFALYETLEVHLQLALVKTVKMKFPETCSSIAACDLSSPQVGTSTSLKLIVNVIPIISLLGAPLLIVPIKMIDITFYDLGPYCNNFFVADSYYGCCGEPETLYPTRSPVLAPTFQPTKTDLEISEQSSTGWYQSTDLGYTTSYWYDAGTNFICSMLRSTADQYGSFIITLCQIGGVTTTESNRYYAQSVYSNGRYYIECASNEGIQHMELSDLLLIVMCNYPTSTMSFEHDECTWSPDYSAGFTHACIDGIITGLTWQSSNNIMSFKCCTVKASSTLQTSNNNNKSNTTTIIISVVVCFVFVAIIIAVAIFYYFRKNKKYRTVDKMDKENRSHQEIVETDYQN